ncbi:MAG: hypothetical protein E3J43_03755 [Candidatus Heimdallarchaeota archaeon]|nr:MAG: hypothetical protein E3J43_03755 [Candidatus Heimdallarchaeota archaeon]
MKKKLTLVTLFLMLSSILFINSSNLNLASFESSMGSVSTFDVDTPEFDHIFGPPGHIALAVAEDDNLIFTNAPEGLALIQLDDLTNQTVYMDEIGLTDVQIQNIEVDKDLKLLYIGSVQGVDILNYSLEPFSVTPLITGVATNFELGDFIDIDPETHFAWIVTQSHGLFVYNPFNDQFVDTSGYNIPAASVDMLAIEVNSTAGYAFIGSKQGLWMTDLGANTTTSFDSVDGLPYDEITLVKYLPSLLTTLVVTHDPVTGVCGGLTVLDMQTLLITSTYNWTSNPYNPRSIIDIEVDLDRGLGYIASFYTTDAESGFLVFNITDYSGIAKSTFGSAGTFGPPMMMGSPEPIESLLATVEIDESTGDVILGTVQRIQKITYTPPTTAVTENSPIIGIQHNFATDIVYDPIDDKVYVDTLLGLDRIDPHTRVIEHLMPPPYMGGAGGDTSGALAVNARMFYHHRYEYNITSGTYRLMEAVVTNLTEYRYVDDISISQDETYVFYSTSQQNNGYSGNGSLLIFNRLNDTTYIFDFGLDKTQLEMNQALEDTTNNVLYVATNKGLILFNLTTFTEIKRFGEVEGWEVQSLELIDGKLWLGMEPYPHIRIFDTVTENVVTWDKAHLISYPSINDIHYEESRNETYILTNSGLYVHNRTNGWIKTEVESDGLSTLFVRRMDFIPTTDEAWIGSFQGINIYNPNYDDKAPSVTVYFPSTILSGLNNIDISAEDFAGIKEIKVRMENGSWNQEWAINANFLRIELDTTLYENGYYDFIINATDWNGLSTTSTIEDILFNNVIVGEFNIAMLFAIFPIIMGISILFKRKHFKI